jgi:hypothetical protein
VKFAELPVGLTSNTPALAVALNRAAAAIDAATMVFLKAVIS